MQYAFLVTSVVQFAGGVVVFFGLLVSPKEVGKLSLTVPDQPGVYFGCHKCLNALFFPGLTFSETVLSPMETDTDSHQPLMSDEEDEEVEVYARQRQPVQQPEEPLTTSSQAISFWRAFLLPGVLPVSADL